jgi:hypothetical protein
MGVRIMRTRLLFLAVLAIAGFAAPQAPLDAKQPTRPSAPRLDLADTAAGVYEGAVISDARGSSRDNVTLTVVKVGPNMVQITSSYKRLPTFTARLERVMHTIQQVGTEHLFLLDLSRSPRRLDIHVDEASWSGDKTD